VSARFLADLARFSYDSTMSQPWDHVPAWAAEFPNDNPALHEGVSWVCLAVCGPAKPVARPRSASRAFDAGAFAGSIAAHPTSVLAVPCPSSVDAGDVVAAIVEPALVVAELRAATTPTPIDGMEERLAPSVLGIFLERLDLELTDVTGLTPTHSSAPSDALPPLSISIDASDLDSLLALPEAAAFFVGPTTPEPFVFDGSCDHGAPDGEAESGMGTGFDATDSIVFDGAVDGGESDLNLVPLPAEAVVAAVEGVGVAALERPDAASSQLGATFAADGAAPVVPKDTVSDSQNSEAFRAFVGALVEVLLVSGATRAAALLPALLDGDDERPTTSLDPEFQQMLLAARFANDAEGRIQLSADFIATARAWRDVLSGASNDLSACGSTTLDGWAGDLLRAFGVGGDGKVDVRRELRRRGVAAFGMLLAA
jgi:hypothetical protein